MKRQGPCSVVNIADTATTLASRLKAKIWTDVTDAEAVHRLSVPSLPYEVLLRVAGSCAEGKRPDSGCFPCVLFRPGLSPRRTRIETDASRLRVTTFEWRGDSGGQYAQEADATVVCRLRGAHKDSLMQEITVCWSQ